MLPRLGAGALIAGLALCAARGEARADGAAAARETKPAPRGALVVAIGDAASAARPLALLVYRDPVLRPSLDDATARVLAGEPPPDASPRLAELAALRASLGAAPSPPAAVPPAAGAAPAPAPGKDAVGRRALAGLGGELGASLVITVAVRDGRPIARALRVSTAAFERVEIGATTTAGADGATRYDWPGAVTTLRALVEPAAPKARTAPVAARPPLAPKPATPPPDQGKGGSFWSSPWFWAALGGVVAVGVTTFVIANEAEGDDVIRMQGRVPQ